MKINAHNRLRNPNIQAFKDGELLVYCTNLLEKIVGGKFSKIDTLNNAHTLVYFTGSNAALSFDSTTLQGLKAIMSKKVILSIVPDNNALVFSLEYV